MKTNIVDNSVPTEIFGYIKLNVFLFSGISLFKIWKPEFYIVTCEYQLSKMESLMKANADFPKTSAPLSLMTTYRMSLISAGFISQDSTFNTIFPDPYNLPVWRMSRINPWIPG